MYTIVSSFTLERRKADTKPTTTLITNSSDAYSILNCSACAYTQQVGDVKVNTQTANVVQFNHIVTPNATYNLTFNIDWSNVDPACTSRTLELSTNGGITYTPAAFENAENTVASINFTAPATISYPVLLRFSCAGVILTNINYTVLRSAEIVNDNFRTPDVNSINTLGYEYFNETSTTPSTADLSKETIIVGAEQFKILQITPSTPTTRLQKVLSGLEVGKTYRVAVILPRTTYNVVHDGTTYQVQNTRLEDKALQVTMPNGVGIGMKDAYYAVAIPNYSFPANSKAGRGLTPDGNYHYWISFVATAPTATVTYLGASNNVFPTESSSTPGGYRLKNAGGRHILGFTLHQKIPTEEDGESDGYRYGFNGKENLSEIYGEGVLQDYGFRIYNANIARFLSVDPLRKDYPNLSLYQFASNSPIEAIDLDGLEAWSTKDGKQAVDSKGKPIVGPLNKDYILRTQMINFFKQADGSGLSKVKAETFQLKENKEFYKLSQLPEEVSTPFGKITVTYKADKGKVDRVIDQKTINAFEDMLKKATKLKDLNIKSINVNSTTNGKHWARSLHYEFKAIDINKINGVKLNTGGKEVWNNATALQELLRNNKDIYENFGPQILILRGKAKSNAKLLTDHSHHVHISTK